MKEKILNVLDIIAIIIVCIAIGVILSAITVGIIVNAWKASISTGLIATSIIVSGIWLALRKELL